MTTWTCATWPSGRTPLPARKNPVAAASGSDGTAPSLSRFRWPPRPGAPGENEKKVICGGVDFAGGRITYAVADKKSGTQFLVFLVALVKAYAGRKIRLICDNGRFHPTKTMRAWLKADRHHLEVFWLPPYRPILNLIERVSGRLKRTVLANVLFQTMDDPVASFRRGASRIKGHRHRRGFMFDHDDVR